MASRGNPDTEELLARAAAGDAAAPPALLERHRSRLKRMLCVRTDERFAARFDDSDVVQEALTEAAGRLTEYLQTRPVPFYPWLRAIAARKLVEHCRHHTRRRRTVSREADSPGPPPIPDHSAVELAHKLVCPRSTPSQAAAKREVRSRVQAALAALEEKDREVLVLCHLERLSAAEAGAVLGLSEQATKSRRRRAILKLGELLEDLRGEFGG